MRVRGKNSFSIRAEEAREAEFRKDWERSTGIVFLAEDIDFDRRVIRTITHSSEGTVHQTQTVESATNPDCAADAMLDAHEGGIA